MRWIFASAVVFLGCGGEASQAERLKGVWAMQTSSVCTLGFSFGTQRPDIYEADLICELRNGALGLEAEVGKYAVQDDILSFTATHATCPDVTAETTSVAFDVEGDTLRLIGPGNAVVLNRVPKMPREAVTVIFGCFDDNKVLVPMDVRPVP